MERIAFVGALSLSVVLTALVIAQTGGSASSQDTATTINTEGGTTYVWTWKGGEVVGLTRYMVMQGTDSRGALDGSPEFVRKDHISVVAAKK
jgi:hypothetical protein